MYDFKKYFANKYFAARTIFKIEDGALEKQTTNKTVDGKTSIQRVFTT